MLTQYDFHPIRQLIKLYTKRIPSSQLPIEDNDCRELFLAACRCCDRANWADSTKAENKKILLVFISKFSRDTAYLPVLKDMMREMKK